MTDEDIIASLLPECRSLRYLHRYVKFISMCVVANGNLDTKEYTEQHHILPSSMFPKYRNLARCPWNCAVLTSRQHVIAHWMLAKAIQNQGMWYALRVLLHAKNSRQKLRYNSSHVKEIAKKRHSSTVKAWLAEIDPDTGLSNAQLRAQKIDQDLYRDNLGCSLREHKSKTMAGDNNPGKRPDVRARNSAAAKERYKHQPGAFSGKKHTEESKRRQSLVKQGDNNPAFNTIWANNGKEQRRVSEDDIPPGFVRGRLGFKKRNRSQIQRCPHCGLEGRGGNMKRFHFDHCKKKSS